MTSFQLIGLTGNFKDVPHIASDLSLDQVDQLFPKGFEDILSFEKDSHTGLVTIIIDNDENKRNTNITFGENLYNPSKNSCVFPRFLIEQEYKKQNIDYLNDTSNRYVFNQNELFYIILQHRLCEFKKYKNAYANLLNTDIKQVMNYVDHNPVSSYNAIQKNLNSYIILSLFDLKTKSLHKVANSQCLGNILKFNAHITPKSYLLSLLSKLPIHFSSESMGEHNKFVIKSYDEPLYRSVGYRLVKNEKDQPEAITIFKPAQNAPARHKTHVTSDAVAIADFEATSVFMQDYIPNNQKKIYEPKDECYRKSICVIHPILDNDKFLFGEVECNVDFNQTVVKVTESVSDQFEKILFNVGETKHADDEGKILVGINILDQPVYLKSQSKSATLIRSTIQGTVGVYKLVFEVCRVAGNARVDSNTGLKGVTICKPNLGTISIPSLDLEIKPDLCFGMNSFKAKKNSIALARAALAVELGTYTPKHKSGLLSTWDMEEINYACNSLPEYTYKDMFGNIQKVQIGIVYARFTELCNIFTSYEKQSFSFEFGRVLNSLPDNRLFKNIWEQYVSEEDIESVVELEKILLDANNIYQDDIPTYTPEQIIQKKIFTDKDLILNIQTPIESRSKILDEDWNKGFFINFSSVGGRCIRFPNAKILNRFCSPTESKMYLYSSLVIRISNIINKILNKQFRYLFPQSENAKSKGNTDIDHFYKEIKGTLFATEDNAKMLIQTLSRPEIPGIAMKQSTDYILPPNVAVVMDEDVIHRASRDALGKAYRSYTATNGFYGIHGRAPFLWSAQACPVQIWSRTDFRNYLLNKHGIVLEDYIHPDFNNDIVIFSNNVLKRSQSDVDGDHSATFIPAGIENQELIREYHDPNVTQSQLDWLDDYIAGERDSNDDLIDPQTGELHKPVYTLYRLPMHTQKLTRNTLSEGFDLYLTRAIIAKANIGVATNDGWVFNMLLELYRQYGIQNKWRYQTDDKSSIKPMTKVTSEQAHDLSFSYTRALQTFVVRGVKHSSNGSADFEILFLKNFWKPKNDKSVFKLLTQDLKLPPILATKMTNVITWSEEMGLLKACAAFLKLYNKGTVPRADDQELLDKFDEFIQQNSYFGNLLEPVYHIRKQAEVKRLLTKQGIAKRREQLKAQPQEFDFVV